MSTKSILLRLREAAKNCPDLSMRMSLYTCANAISGWMNSLYKSCDAESLQRLNGEWALAERLLKAATPAGDDNTRGGAMKAPVFQEPMKVAA